MNSTEYYTQILNQYYPSLWTWASFIIFIFFILWFIVHVVFVVMIRLRWITRFFAKKKKLDLQESVAEEDSHKAIEEEAGKEIEI